MVDLVVSNLTSDITSGLINTVVSGLLYLLPIAGVLVVSIAFVRFVIKIFWGITGYMFKPKVTINNSISIETMLEKNTGWPEGVRAKFDTALFHKDTFTVKCLLPQVPEEYKQRFHNEINAVVNKDNLSGAQYWQAQGVKINGI